MKLSHSLLSNMAIGKTIIAVLLNVIIWVWSFKDPSARFLYGVIASSVILLVYGEVLFTSRLRNSATVISNAIGKNLSEKM